MGKLETLYSYVPPIIQEIGMSIYAYSRRLKRHNSKGKFLKRLLSESYYWNNDEIDRYQKTQLRELLVYARKNSRFYSFLTDEVIDNVVENRDLSKLPILHKDILRNNFDNLLTKSKKLNIFHTSGSTGTPLKVAITDNEWSLEYAFVWRHRRLAGISERDKWAAFTGRKIITEKKPKSFWRYNFCDKQLLFSAYHMNNDTLGMYISKFNDFDCTYIQGYPSLIYNFVKYALDNNLPLKRLKAVFTSSETLFDYQRELIEVAFDCKVYDYYGSTERAGIITQCEFGTYHVNIESGILETINNRLLWTSFINKTTPLIRYDIGDSGQVEVSNSICDCGSMFPVVKNMNGRTNEQIFTKNNVALGTAILEHIFKKDIDIKEAQIFQKVKGEIIVKIVPGKDYNHEAAISIVNKNFYEKVGDDLLVSIQLVDEIARSRNGKFKFIISEIEG